MQNKFHVIGRPQKGIVLRVFKVHRVVSIYGHGPNTRSLAQRHLVASRMREAKARKQTKRLEAEVKTFAARSQNAMTGIRVRALTTYKFHKKLVARSSSAPSRLQIVVRGEGGDKLPMSPKGVMELCYSQFVRSESPEVCASPIPPFPIGNQTLHVHPRGQGLRDMARA